MSSLTTIFQPIVQLFQGVPEETVSVATLERRRLNRRIHTITGTDHARDLARYRRDICKPHKVRARGAQFVTIQFDGREFVEPEDALTLMHQWLDSDGVPTLL